MIETKTVEIFTTTDNREFTDKAEAVRHQGWLDRESSIERFIGDMNDRGKTRARNLLRRFAEFEAESAHG